MTNEEDRAANGARANDSPCPTRRGVLAGIATLAATASITRASRYDEAIFYLHGEFQSAAGSMRGANGKTQALLIRRLTALATALSVLPSGSLDGHQIKRQVAGWSHQEGYCKFHLPSEVVNSLKSPV